jgi:hypothetical protein
MNFEMIEESILQNITTYYGLDWITIILGITGYLLITEKKAIGFLFNAASVIAAAFVALIAFQWGFLVANLIQFGVAIRAYIKWKSEEKLMTRNSRLKQQLK